MSSSPMGAPSRELARFVTDELRATLPQGVDIASEGPDVVVSFRGFESRNGMASILDEDDGRSLAERLESAALALLSHVQDVAADASTVPWPGSDATLPLPGTEVSGGRLHAWFGNRDSPDLVLREVEVSAFAG